MMKGLKDDHAIAWIDFCNSPVVKAFYADQRRKRRRFWLSTLGSIIGALFAIWLFSGCNSFGTIARHEVRQTQASYTSTGQDSGILKDAPNKTGFSVNQDWINGYDALLERFGKRLTPSRQKGDRDGIVKEGDHYRISDSVMERQQYMNQLRSDEGP